MTQKEQQQLGKTLWNIADQLRGAMNADDFRDYMLSFLFLRYLSSNYEEAAKKELSRDYPKLETDAKRTPLGVWYEANEEDVPEFEKQMRRKVHYVIKPQHLWSNITELARQQKGELLQTLEKGFRYIENESFANSFQGLFSEINLNSEKLGRTPADDTLAEDFRFKSYGLAPKSAADFAFLLHGFHFLSENGTMAIILPHGVLFRGGAEERIRTKNK
jgi:type I restriction enzyme M protein